MLKRSHRSDLSNGVSMENRTPTNSVTGYHPKPLNDRDIWWARGNSNPQGLRPQHFKCCAFTHFATRPYSITGGRVVDVGLPLATGSYPTPLKNDGLRSPYPSLPTDRTLYVINASATAPMLTCKLVELVGVEPTSRQGHFGLNAARNRYNPISMEV